MTTSPKKKTHKGGDHSYRQCLVAFIDLLGFKQMIENRPPSEIAQALERARQHVRDDQDLEELYEGAFFAFSDSLVRIRPIDTAVNKEYPLGLLFHELVHLVHAQAELSNAGVFIRGAVTIGNMYFDRETAFGPALVKAYQLESQTALYPRIILDPALLKELDSNPLLKKDTHDLEEEKEYIKKLVRLDSDGFWHIDHLKAVAEEADSPTHYVKFLAKHKKHVESAITTQTASIYAKMSWLSQYHNETIGKLNKGVLKSEGVTSEDLLIKAQGPLRYDL